LKGITILTRAILLREETKNLIPSYNRPPFFQVKTTQKKDTSAPSKAVSSLSCLFTTGDQAIVGLFGEKRRLSLDDAG
jgi:hypothetical protein